MLHFAAVEVQAASSSPDTPYFFECLFVGGFNFFRKLVFLFSRGAAPFSWPSVVDTLSLNEFAGFFFPSTERKTVDKIYDPVGETPIIHYPQGVPRKPCASPWLTKPYGHLTCCPPRQSSANMIHQFHLIFFLILECLLIVNVSKRSKHFENTEETQIFGTSSPGA